MIYMYVHRRQLRIFTFTNLSFWMPLCLHISQVLSLPCVSVNIHFVITSPEHFVHAFFVSNQEWYVFHFTNVLNSSTWGRNYKIRPQARSYNEGPLPSSVYLGRHWHHSCDKTYQAFPFRFCILQAIENWMVGRPGNEARSERFLSNILDSKAPIRWQKCMSHDINNCILIKPKWR